MGTAKLTTQPRPSKITSCLVAGMPATFQPHRRPSTNSVISNGSGTPTGVNTFPREPSAKGPRPFNSAPATVGPHIGQAERSVITSHAAPGGTDIARSTVGMPRRKFRRIAPWVADMTDRETSVVRLNRCSTRRKKFQRDGVTLGRIVSAVGPRWGVGPPAHFVTVVEREGGRGCRVVGSSDWQFLAGDFS